ncbi:MAG: hypothetical protein ACI9F9_001665 [Candidatus Paceibacteria bacterium]|jgi:hypothetical protein
MAEKQVSLDLAAYLDSSQCAALEVPPDAQRKIVRWFLEIAYDELGKKPHLLDGHDVHHALGHLLPTRMARKDPLAKVVPDVLTALFAQLEEAAMVPHAYEMRQGLAATLDEFQETVRTGHNAHHHHERQKPVVHQAAKLGRNDPCSCGSGKKFKKCHGKNS